MSKNNIGTPYDDVFRTLVNDCTSLIIPVVNEVFGEHYTGEEKITFLPGEHIMNQQGTNTKEKITDSCFEIHGITKLMKRTLMNTKVMKINWKSSKKNMQILEYVWKN